MSFAVVKKTDGLSVIVNNTVLDTGATPYAVSNDALDTGAGTHTLFGATVPVTPVTILNFKLYDNRIFTI